MGTVHPLLCFTLPYHIPPPYTTKTNSVQARCFQAFLRHNEGAFRAARFSRRAETGKFPASLLADCRRVEHCNFFSCLSWHKSHFSRSAWPLCTIRCDCDSTRRFQLWHDRVCETLPQRCAEGFSPTDLFSQLFITQDSCMCDAHMTFRRVLAFNIHRCSTHCCCINGRCPNTFILSSSITTVRDCGTVVFASDQHDNLGVCVLPYPLGAHMRHQCMLFLQAYVLVDDSEEESEEESDDETSEMKKRRLG